MHGSAKQHRDVAEMTESGTAVARFDRSNRVHSNLNAIEEVAHVRRHAGFGKVADTQK